jgi:phenylalanyl-tRNA synthetase beta chain
VAYTFFDAKGHVEEIIAHFESKAVSYDRTVPSYFHPGRSARVLLDGKEVARFGQIHPDIAAARKLKQDVYLAEILIENLYAHELRAPHYRPVAKYPAVERDFSMLFPEGTEFDKMRAAIAALKIAELAAFEPVEIFRGGTLPKDRYSLLVRARYQSPERTLRDEEINQWSQQIVKALETLGGTMRS